MTVTVSIVLLLAIAVVLMIRAGKIALGPAILVLLLGLYLGDTSFATSLREMTQSAADALSAIRI